MLIEIISWKEIQNTQKILQNIRLLNTNNIYSINFYFKKDNQIISEELSGVFICDEKILKKNYFVEVDILGEINWNTSIRKINSSESFIKQELTKTMIQGCLYSTQQDSYIKGGFFTVNTNIIGTPTPYIGNVRILVDGLLIYDIGL